MTQPVSLALVQVGMWANVPPTVFPVGTWTLPPRMMADTIRSRSAALPSTCERNSLMRLAAPCECPMKMMGRP